MLVNFREYILKIALTRSIFQPKMHQIAFGGRAQPGTAGGACTPQIPSWIKGSLLLREGDAKKVKGVEGDEVEGEGREKGSEGR